MSFETLFAMVVLAAVTVIVAVGLFGRSNKKKYRDKDLKRDDNAFLIDDNDSELGANTNDGVCDSCADCDCGGDD